MIINRPQIIQEEIDAGFERLRAAMQHKLEKHGWGSWISTHEAMGIIDEEARETYKAVDSRNKEEFEKELLDMATAALFAEISCRTDKMDVR